MSALAIGALGFAALLILVVLRIPIAIAMLTVGFVGTWALLGWLPLIQQLKSLAYWRFATYDLSVVPLFLLMGQFATKAGISRGLFEACNAWVGHRRGGLAMATVGACGAFAAVCGSSLATASTMGQVALPEMRRLGYSGALSTGTVAAGGTLGILIPPSVILIIYAILTEQNIVDLFIAALVPGLLALFGYVLAVAVYVRLKPGDAPAGGGRLPLAERFQALAGIWPVVLIFLLVIGGIYLGWFTPTQAAAVGAVATGLMAVALGGMRWEGFVESLKGAAVTTGMIFLILLGAAAFNAFLALTQLPNEAAGAIAGSALSPWLILAGLLVAYLLLGCVMDSLSIILLTVPIFFPIVLALDFGLPPEEVGIWFGILALIVVEVGLITPPIGMNVFIIHGLAGDVPMGRIFQGVLPFLAAEALRIALIAAIPGLTLWLVRWWG